MDRSIYLAKLLGPVLIILGLSLLVHPSFASSIIRDFIYYPMLLFLMCALGLLGGIALILAHNVWAKDWRLIITLLGWWSAVTSTAFLHIPRTTLPLLIPELVLVSGAIALLLGSILSYFSYRASRQSTDHPGRSQ